MKNLLMNILVLVVLLSLLISCSTQSQTDFTKIQYFILPSDLDWQIEATEEIEMSHYSNNKLTDINKFSIEQREIVRYMFSTSIKMIKIYNPKITHINNMAIKNIKKMIDKNNKNFLTNDTEKNKWSTIVKNLRKMQGFDRLDNTTFLKRHKSRLVKLMISVFK